MKLRSKHFRVRPGEKINLSEWPTRVKPFCKSKKQYQELLHEHVDKLDAMQRLHYASNRYALLLIFQGMDAAGKDGASGTSCPESIRKAAKSSASSSRPPTSRNMTFSAAPRGICRTWADRRLQPILLRGSARRSRAPGSSPRPAPCRRIGQRQEHLEGAFSVDRGFESASASQRNTSRTLGG